MSLHEDLSEVLVLNRRITNLNIQIAALESCLLPSGIAYDKDKVQSSPGDKMSEICAEIFAKEKKRDELIRSLPAAVKRVEDIINRLPEGNHRNVMILWYIGGRSAGQIQDDIGYQEISSVYKARRVAIKKLSMDTVFH